MRNLEFARNRPVPLERPSEILPGEATRAAGDQNVVGDQAGARTTGFASNDELADAVEISFLNEPVDRSWAIEARDDYLRVIKGQLPRQSRVESLECREKFCRLQITHESQQVSNEFLMGLFPVVDGPLAANSGGFRASEPTQLPDGTVRVLVYIARPGVDLSIRPGVEDVAAP